MQALSVAREAVVENLCDTMRHYAVAAGLGHVERHAGLMLIASGIRYPVFNTAVFVPPGATTQDEVAARVVTASNFFNRRGLPWSAWICDEMLGPRLLDVSRALLEARSLRPIARHVGMQSGALAAPRRTLPDLSFRPVRDEATRSDFCQISESVFEVPVSVGRQIYGQEPVWTAGVMRGWVGYASGQPACSAATMVSAHSVGLYCVATLPQFQRRGFAERISRFALAESGTESGPAAILHATPAGLPLYTKMGYQPVAHISVFA